MPLKEFIEKYFKGSQVKFAAAQGVDKTQVTQWINKDFRVIDGELYSRRRVLNFNQVGDV